MKSHHTKDTFATMLENSLISEMRFLHPNFGKRRPSLGSCQQKTKHIDLRHSQDLEMRYSVRKRSTKSRENMCRKHINVWLLFTQESELTLSISIFLMETQRVTPSYIL